MKPATILVVEDNPISMKMTRVALEAENYTVIMAEDGRTALELVQTHSIDLILQDLQLPDIHGTELVGRIRSLPGMERVPILAVTGFTSEAERLASVNVVEGQTGFTDYLVKPVEPSRLVKIVRAYLLSQTSTPQTLRQGPSPYRRLLIANDNLSDLRLLKTNLERLGFEVTCAPDGQEALEQARQCRPDAIITDTLMPRLDGFRFCQAIKEDAQLCGLPVVMMSGTYFVESDQDLARSVGALGMIEHKADFEATILAILAMLEDGRTRGEGSGTRDEEREGIGSPLTPRPSPLDSPLAAAQFPVEKYARAVSRQLEQHVRLEQVQQQRISQLEARLAVLGGFTRAVELSAPLPKVLDEVLRCALNAAGISNGAIYLEDSGGFLRLATKVGFASESSEVVTGFFRKFDGLRAHEVRWNPITTCDLVGSGEQAGTDAKSFLAAPLLLGGRRVGALLLTSEEKQLGSDWLDFAQALGNQIADTIELTRSLEALRSSENRYRELNTELEQRVAELLHAAAENAQMLDLLRTSGAELARSNQDLKQFAYVASHDLQEPLRKVSLFAQLLATQYKGKLDTDADDTISSIVDGAGRMQNLIQSLLLYARLGHTGLPFAPVNCNAVLQQALANLQVAIEAEGAVIAIAPLPTVLADAKQLVQLFQNLIGNAVKFHGAEKPVIQVQAEPNGPQWTFTVRDNGIGIDAQFAERIFLIFQRLHSREEYSGTGIGLAVCKKVVEMHGGRIWLESERPANGVCKGATFSFTLPRTIETEQPTHESSEQQNYRNLAGGRRPGGHPPDGGRSQADDDALQPQLRP
jgi:signal transduction histidine kinase/DNA-binding response OmpR family regulator